MSLVPDKTLFRKVWGQFPTGVSVITFYEDDGATVHGLTANSVCSVSLDPLLVLVCIDHKARSFPMLSKSKRFVMNFLAKNQSEQSRYFARNDTVGQPPFDFTQSGHGFPVLKGVIAYMDCAIVAKHPAGDHSIFVGKVDEIELLGSDPLVFCLGKYTQVVTPLG